jgi:predicted Zn-dependent protease
MANSFRGLRDVSTVEDRVKELRNTAPIRDGIRDEQQQIRRQRDLEGQLSTLIAAGDRTRLPQPASASDSKPADDQPIDPTMRLHELVSELRRQSAAAQDSSARRVARRVLEGAYIGLFERASNLLQVQKRFDEAVRVLNAATEINPDRAGGFYYLAWAYAAKGDRKKALQALKTAVDKGFSDRAGLNDNSAFDSLRENPEFEKITARIKP